jgi:cytochrome bd-type quinol oxidase subunit 2
MKGIAKSGLVLATLAVGLGASFFIAQGWSPVCHEGCPRPIQLSMWLFLLALPLGAAGVVAVVAGRPRAPVRIALTLAAFAIVGVLLTLVAAWFQSHGRGG